MVKTFVLDTNVLLSSPNSIFSFDDNEVIITDIVLEELDNKKKGHDDINFAARQVARYLYDLKNTLSNTDKTLFDGVKLSNGGLLKIVSTDNFSNIELPESWTSDKHDNLILKVCYGLAQDKTKDVILVSNDVLMCIKADAWNIKNEPFKTDRTDADKLYTGTIDLFAAEDDFNEFVANGQILLDKLYEYKEIYASETGYESIYDWPRYPNCFVTLFNAATGKTMLGKVSTDTKYLVKLKYANCYPFGITAKNASQQFMIEALMDPEIKLVTIAGPAGSAKTFVTLACGLEKCLERNFEENEYYRKIMLCRPNQLIEDLGYLPGTLEEKIHPLFKCIYDNLAVLIDSSSDSRHEDTDEEIQDKIDELVARGIISFESLAYIRGRSITDTFFIADEFQNATYNQAVTLITRIGDCSKIIISGDFEQIDNSYLDKHNCGLSMIIDKMKESKLSATITTKEKDCIRSALAKEAIKYLH